MRRSQVWSVAWMIQLCDPLFCYKNRCSQRLHCKACPILVSRDDEKNAFTVGKRYGAVKNENDRRGFLVFVRKNVVPGEKIERSRYLH